jgi:hypothetical protein
MNMGELDFYDMQLDNIQAFLLACPDWNTDDTDGTDLRDHLVKIAVLICPIRVPKYSNQDTT